MPFGRLPCAELLCDLLFVKAKVFIGVVSLNIGKFANNKQTCFIEMKDGLGSNVPSWVDFVKKLSNSPYKTILIVYRKFSIVFDFQILVFFIQAISNYANTKNILLKWRFLTFFTVCRRFAMVRMVPTRNKGKDISWVSRMTKTIHQCISSLTNNRIGSPSNPWHSCPRARKYYKVCHSRWSYKTWDKLRHADLLQPPIITLVYKFK